MWDSNKQSQQQQTYNVPSYNIPTSSIPTYPAVQHVGVENQGWWERNHKNKPQSNAVGAASFVFMSGGMNMAWNLGFPTDNYTDTFFLLSWFVGGIIGAVIGAIICNLIHRKLIIGFACLLVTISGVLQVSDPQSYDALVASRYINGIAVGLVFPLTFVLVGEVVVKSLRGMNAVAVDTMSFGCGIFLQTIYAYMWTGENSQSFSATQTYGILNIIWGSIGFIIALTLFIESPIFYLRRGQEQMAIDSLRRLQRPFTITNETFEQLDEHKRYLAESKEQGFIRSAIIGLPALAKLCFYRSFTALSFSYFVNYAFTYSCSPLSLLDIWPFYFYGMARWFGGMIVMFFIDSKGRKPSMTSGFLICSILAFFVGGARLDYNYSYMSVVKIILIFYQLFASISMASSSVYLTEAFPLAVKPYYIAIVFIVEMSVHIIICCARALPVDFNLVYISDFFYSLGGLSLIFFLVAVFMMPETKLNTLRECLTKFKKLFHSN